MKVVDCGVTPAFVSGIDHLHGLGGREGAGLRPGPNVLTKVPRPEGILALQVLCSSRKLPPLLPFASFSVHSVHVFGG